MLQPFRQEKINQGEGLRIPPPFFIRLACLGQSSFRTCSDLTQPPRWCVPQTLDHTTPW